MRTQTVIITGAAHGIGEAITKRCIAQGFRVLACDVDVHGLENLRLAYSPAQLYSAVVDIADYQQTAAFFEELRINNEQPNYLVNNAGIYLGKNILDYGVDEMERVMRVNCFGAIYFSQFFARPLLREKRSGVIVNISSVAGEEGSSDALYGATKAALLGLTKSCALNFAPHIRVNAVAPALVETRLIEKVPSFRVKEYRATELLPEPITPEDIADTVSFLLSDQSKHYTGAILDINNGQYRR